MAAGIPGVGIGGIFHLASALVMPLREMVLVLRGVPGAGSAARWKPIARQWCLAIGILGAIWVTGLLFGLMLSTSLVRAGGDGAVSVNFEKTTHVVVLRAAALLLSFGTLIAVLLLVQIARLCRGTIRRVRPAVELETGAGPVAAPDDAAPGRRLLSLLIVASLATFGAPSASAQDVAVLRTAAEQAYESGDRALADRAYTALVAAAPDDSRAIFRLAGLRATDPAESVRLYSRYVVLEPADAWGWLALAETQLRRGRYREAARAVDQAERIAPKEPDVLRTRSRVLARSGRTDEVIDAYEHAASASPHDAELLRELASQQWRAGRQREAIDALVAAQTLAARAADARRLAQWRAEARMALVPTVTGTRDSDGNDVRRAALALRSPSLGRATLALSAGRSVASDGSGNVNIDHGTVGLAARPLATTRIEASGGVARLSGPALLTAPTLSATVPIGQLRVRWRGAADGAAVDLRGTRQLLDATPLLVRNHVLRSEAAAQVELPVASLFRLRGLGRMAQIDADGTSNQRTLVGGALVRPVSGWGEIAIAAQRLAFADPTTRGYFAPEHAEFAELAAYVERESDAGVTLALDLGAGAQRVTPFGSPTRAWEPALRAWGQLEVPVGRARAVRAELDLYDGGVGADAVAATPAAHWRWGSLSLGMRWGL